MNTTPKIPIIDWISCGDGDYEGMVEQMGLRIVILFFGFVNMGIVVLVLFLLLKV